MQLSLSTDFASILHGKTVYCGFSGGADSLTLLVLLMEAQEAFHFSLNAIHFEHGLRGGAGEQDAEFCLDFCKKSNIPFSSISLNVPENMLPGEGIEAAARRLRMQHWKQLPQDSIVALGHNADDLTENLFLRLMRGSNVSALTSLAEYNETDGIRIIRPLLSIHRNDIQKFLQGRGLQWRTDATNLQSDYGRNFLRNQILPQLFEKFHYGKDGILRSLKNLRTDAQFIDNQAKTVYRNMNPFLRKSWIGLQNAIFCRIFRLFLSQYLAENVIVGHQLLERFEFMIQNPPGQGFSELLITDYPEYSLFVGNTEIYLIDHRKIEPFFWNPLETANVRIFGDSFAVASNAAGKGDGIKNAAFDMQSLALPLIIRQSQPGDKMTPFGRSTPVSIKKFLSDAHIPEPLREHYPVLCDNAGEIIWIPGVKRSNKYPARDSEYLSITFCSSTSRFS